ncbi:MAG: late control protein [Pseudomonadota bacterium]
MSATIRDESGQDSDTLDLVFNNREYEIAPPPKGAILEPKFGYAGGEITSMGKFEVNKIRSVGGPDGILLEVSGKAASVSKKLKQKGSQHFENTTLGSVLKKTFSAAGESIEIDGQLAGTAVEYETRNNQPALDFANRLADKYNAIFKAGGGKYIFVPRGSQSKPGGGTVAGITVDRFECEDWEIKTEPRPSYSKVGVHWYDEKKSKTELEEAETGLDGPTHRLPHKARHKAEAKALAEAEAARLNRKTGSGHFTQYGRTDASAEMDVTAINFGPIENGKWRCSAVENEFSDNGWRTTIEVEAPEKGKS